MKLTKHEIGLINSMIYTFENRAAKGGVSDNAALSELIQTFDLYRVELLKKIKASKNEHWKPIQTAPKDGSHILLFRPSIIFVGYYATGLETWIISAPGLPTMEPGPTHWMPEPEMPEMPE